VVGEESVPSTGQLDANQLPPALSSKETPKLQPGEMGANDGRPVGLDLPAEAFLGATGERLVDVGDTVDLLVEELGGAVDDVPEGKDPGRA
jgi:hypothetical protein